MGDVERLERGAYRTMHKLTLHTRDKPLRRILCLGAHSDDIEIGCGGSILRLLEEAEDVYVTWIVLSGDDKRANEAKESAKRFLAMSGKREIKVESFRDGFFPYEGVRIKDYFEGLKAELSPDLIFTHWGGDAHQDHRLVSELTWNTYRNHFILEYEVIKYDGDLGRPNVYFPLSERDAARKTDTILESFASQTGRHWFTAAAFNSIMYIRGIECSAPEGFAEAFYARKVIL